MELLNAFRVLAARRIAVGVGALAALLVGLLLAGALPVGPQAGAGTSVSGVGLTRVLLDRPRSLVVDSTVDGADTAVTRAQLLADLMTTDDARARVARQAGVPVDQVQIRGPHAGTATPFSPLSVAASKEANAGGAPDVVVVSVGDTTPIVEFDTVAPTVAGARRLADAATAALRQIASVPASEGPSGVVVRPLGVAQAEAVVSSAGSHKIVAIIGTLFVFCAWCFMVVIAAGLRRAWSRAVLA